MAVASTTGHRGKGPFAAKGGFELPLTNMAAAAALGATGPGRFSLDSLLGLRLPRRLARLALVGGVAAAATMIARSAVRVRRDMPAMASAAEASFPHTSGRAADSSAEGRVRPSAVTGAG